jgi:hypothetical protein
MESLEGSDFLHTVSPVFGENGRNLGKHPGNLTCCKLFLKGTAADDLL